MEIELQFTLSFLSPYFNGFRKTRVKNIVALFGLLKGINRNNASYDKFAHLGFLNKGNDPKYKQFWEQKL